MPSIFNDKRGIQALNQLKDSFSTPKHPDFCCRYYIYFFSAVQFKVGDNLPSLAIRSDIAGSWLFSLPRIESDELNRKCPELFSRLWDFLTLGRNREAMRDLALEMETCNCDRSDSIVDEFHSWHWLDADVAPPPFSDAFLRREDTLEALIGQIAWLLQYPIQEYGARPDLKLHKRLRSWPPSKGFFVDEAKTGEEVKMLCRWLDEYPDVELVKLMSDCCRAAKTILVDLIHSKNAVVDTLLHSLALPKNIVILLNLAVNALPNLDKLEGTIYLRNLQPITIVLELIYRLENMIADGISVAYFYDEYAEPLLQVYSRILRLDDKLSNFPSQRMWLTMSAGNIHSKLVLPYDEAIYHSSILQVSRQRYDHRLRTIETFPEARKILLILMSTKNCANPECEQVQPPGTSWGRCKKCERVIYCSKDCQILDWHLTAKPHKSICKILLEVGTIASFPPVLTDGKELPSLSEAQFENRCRLAGIDSSRLDRMNSLCAQDIRIWKKLMNDYAPRYENRFE